MTEQTTERATYRDLAEGRIDKVLSDRTGLVPISEHFGGLRFENAMQVAEAAKLMATAGPLLPPWLQANPGGCWGIIIRANELNISPLALANWSYVTENHGVKRIAFESGFYHAVVEARAPIKERLRHEIIGEGDERRCKVWATFRNELEPRVFISETLGKLRPPRNDRGTIKGSPLWERKPEVQMFYDASRDWARINCPDVLSGLYTRDELADYAEEGHFGADNAKVVANPQPTPRLRLGERRAERASELSAHTNAAFTHPADEAPPDAQLAGTDADGQRKTSASEAPPEAVPRAPQPQAEGGAPIEAADERQADESAPAEGGAGPVSSTGAVTEQPTNDDGGVAQKSDSDVAENSKVHDVDDAAPGRGHPSAASPKTEDEPPDLAQAYRRGMQDRRDGMKKRAVPPEYRDSAHSHHAARWMAGWQSEDDAMAGRS